jgi:hypothetical protein
MLVFGLVSAIFDFVTFAVLQGGFHARPELFRTAWFVESLLTSWSSGWWFAHAPEPRSDGHDHR